MHLYSLQRLMFVAGVFIHKVLVFLFIIVVAVEIRPPLFLLPCALSVGAAPRRTPWSRSARDGAVFFMVRFWSRPGFFMVSKIFGRVGQLPEPCPGTPGTTPKLKGNKKGD